MKKVLVFLFALIVSVSTVTSTAFGKVIPKRPPINTDGPTNPPGGNGGGGR
ncbi:MAG: hypothetical protein OHK0056_31490 [Bacteriovoracaceae bacterium]